MPAKKSAPARASSLWGETPISWIGSRPIEQRGDGVVEDVFEARPPLLPPDALERTDDARRDYTPPRSPLTARARKDFSDRHREQFNGKGSSQRSFSLVEKLREVEAVMTTALQTHQSLRQLTGDDEVYGAVTGSCGTKVCFQVGGDDARKMADEFGGFVAADLMNLPKLHALARVGSRDASFNLETFFLPDPERPADEAAANLRERTRRRYATPKADIRKELEALREFLPKRTSVDPFNTLAAKAKQERKAREAATEVAATDDATPAEDAPTAPSVKPESQADASAGAPAPEPPETLELKSGKAEATKNAIIQAAGAWGYSHRTEQGILGEPRRVDLVLTKADLVGACEISATTSAPHEVSNVMKCLREGFARIIHVAPAPPRGTRRGPVFTRRLAADRVSDSPPDHCPAGGTGHGAAERRRPGHDGQDGLRSGRAIVRGRPGGGQGRRLVQDRREHGAGSEGQTAAELG